jgi:hypothetical protein
VKFCIKPGYAHIPKNVKGMLQSWVDIWPTAKIVEMLLLKLEPDKGAGLILADKIVEKFCLDGAQEICLANTVSEKQLERELGQDRPYLMAGIAHQQVTDRAKQVAELQEVEREKWKTVPEGNLPLPDISTLRQDLIKAQQDDPTTYEIIQTLLKKVGADHEWVHQAQIRKTAAEVKKFSLHERDGLLLREVYLISSTAYVPVIPTAQCPYAEPGTTWRRWFFLYIHDSPMSGHMDQRRTEASLKRMCWWPRMGSDTEWWFATCESCGRTRR